MTLHQKLTIRLAISILLRMVLLPIFLLCLIGIYKTEETLTMEKDLKLKHVRYLSNWGVFIAMLNMIYFNINFRVMTISICLVISLIYWPLYFIDKNLVISKSMRGENYMGYFWDVIMHLCPFLSAIFTQFITLKLERPVASRYTAFIVLFGASYILILEIVDKIKDEPVYGFLTIMNPIFKRIFYIIVLVILIGFGMVTALCINLLNAYKKTYLLK